MFTVHVPAMTARQDVRAISASISDVPGVQTLQADLATRTVQVTGPVDPTAVTAAVIAAGFAIAAATDGSPPPGIPRTGGRPVDTFFSTDTTGLPEATRQQSLDIADGDELQLRLGPVAKQLAGTTVRMLAYNGSIPGPTLRVRQGSQIVVHVTNDTDLETTVHWHGLRLENRYDGVPGQTQTPIPPGGDFSYRLPFVDPGLFWYHPHVREDYTQEMGLYGTVLVDPAEPDYWPPAHRDVVLTLDDVLLEDGVIAPFSRTETDYAAMGRYGNLLLVAGETDLTLTARTGEVLRLWLVNTANSRVFRVALPGARMKLIGGDNGRVEQEQFVDYVTLAPSERAVVDVLVDRAGRYALEHRTPDRIYRLASISVTEEAAAPPLAEVFGRLRSAPELTAERRQLDRWLAAPPDKVIAVVAEMDMGDMGMGDMDMGGMGEMDMGGMDMGHDGDMGHEMPKGHDMPGVPDDAGDGIEWEDHMVEMNRAMTSANMHWRLLDRTAGRDAPPDDWRFTVGDRVKLRVVNEADSDHPMHHPFHIHGAGRFLVLARDGTPEPNLVWKDTVLIPTGQTVDLLFDVTHPGRWMAHCHIAEHMHSGMMFTFTVTPAATS
ncbi:multicopper oxidase domain-containing protein [Geodermatophilus sp. CPCC 205761]|uniref:multicopper oxidase domain-containing protein n=1 Tax=Geodermatophilus sp. CPCC 205761 TaxID=2936597 RepID=UPI003EE8D3DE